MIKKRIFITGGAGFIGSHLADRLIEDGFFVTIYDNLSSGKKEFISKHFSNKCFKFIEDDLLELKKIKYAIFGHDVIFHLAANPDARAGINMTDLDLKLETIATYNVLEAMRINGIKKIVLSSSGTIYGETPFCPLSEDYGPALPISLYGAGKLASEGLVSAFCHTFDFQGWIYRFGNVIGSRATHGLIYDLINKLKKNIYELEVLGDGSQTKPYLHVNDCVDGMIYGYTHSDSKINVFNLGSETQSSVKEIVEILINEMNLKNTKINYTGGDRGWPGDVPKCKYDVNKMKRLGWTTRYSSNESVKYAARQIVDEMWRI